MAFYSLDAEDASQYEQWLAIWSNWDACEVFAHPEYVKLFAGKNDRAICLVQETPDSLILLPIIQRPLAAEIWAGKDNKHSDATAPYGYGGPYAKGNYDMDEFWRQLSLWAREQAVICLFLRLSPSAADISKNIENLESCGNIVVRSLIEGKDAIWLDYKHSVRTCVKCAQNNGMVIEIDENGKHTQDFIRIYYGTMQRLNAQAQYYFSEEFFQNIFNKLKGYYALWHVRYQEQIVASKLVLISKDHLYPFLGGADEAYFKMNVNPFVDTAIFNWGIEHGKKYCVLGGGHNGKADGVFQYKKKFSPSGVVPFLIGKQVFDHQAYDRTLEKRERYEADKGRFISPDESYFPAYRAIID